MEKKYEFTFIDGFSAKYKVFCIHAESFAEAVGKFNDFYGAAFDHTFLTIKEENKLVFDVDTELNVYNF